MNVPTFTNIPADSLKAAAKRGELAKCNTCHSLTLDQALHARWHAEQEPPALPVGTNARLFPLTERVRDFLDQAGRATGVRGAS